VVKVDISKDQTAEGLKISLMLTAVDASTGRILASKPEISGRKRASTDAICTAMVELMINDFLKAISTSMAYKINKGNSVALNFTIDSGSAINMDTEIGDTYLPLSDVLILWLKDNAKNGKYHQKGRSSTMLSLDEIMIQNKSANGQDMNVNDFSLELYKYLRSLNIVVKRNIVGNTIHITIM
ncbi:MAG: DUF6175 family protein, partial [Bacteroidales bacterium]